MRKKTIIWMLLGVIVWVVGYFIPQPFRFIGYIFNVTGGLIFGWNLAIITKK